MSQASKPVARAGRVAFELDRFELTDGQRCELEGRWFGVRGRRFMRPALTVVVDGRSTRLLADLAGKPWAAEDGEAWNAAFPFTLEGVELLEAELTVAPDITITLPLAAEIVAGKLKPPTAGPERPRSGGDRRARPRPRVQAGNELASLAGELADAEAEKSRLQRQLDHAEAERADAVARMDELLGQLSQTARERDDAQTDRDQLATDLAALERERNQLIAERDAARRARDEAIEMSEAAGAARDRALADRGAAVAAQGRLEAEREVAVAERDRAVSERDGALSLRDHALAERNAAVAARDDAVYQRDALSRTSERLQSELANVVSTRGAALVMRRAAQERPASRLHVPVLAIAIGVIVVLAIVLVIVLVA